MEHRQAPANFIIPFIPFILCRKSIFMNKKALLFEFQNVLTVNLLLVYNEIAKANNLKELLI